MAILCTKVHTERKGRKTVQRSVSGQFQSASSFIFSCSKESTFVVSPLTQHKLVPTTLLVCFLMVNSFKSNSKQSFALKKGKLYTYGKGDNITSVFLREPFVLLAFLPKDVQVRERAVKRLPFRPSSSSCWCVYTCK